MDLPNENTFLSDTVKESSKIPFDTLIDYHKQQASEELVYLTILFTIIVGIIGYLGTASKVDKSARILVLIFYIGIHLVIQLSLYYSANIHRALHQEITAYALNNPESFINSEESPLYKALVEDQKENKPNPNDIAVIGSILLVIVSLCILSIGNQKILQWEWMTRWISHRIRILKGNAK